LKTLLLAGESDPAIDYAVQVFLPVLAPPGRCAIMMPGREIMAEATCGEINPRLGIRRVLAILHLLFVLIAVFLLAGVSFSLWHLWWPGMLALLAIPFLILRAGRRKLVIAASIVVLYSCGSLWLSTVLVALSESRLSASEPVTATIVYLALAALEVWTIVFASRH
jgi:hypothetical protein